MNVFTCPDVRTEGPGPRRAIWGSEIDNYTEHCGYRHIPFAAVKECVRVFVCASHMCLSSSVFIEISHNLAGKQQPIKITTICMHKALANLSREPSESTSFQ